MNTRNIHPPHLQDTDFAPARHYLQSQVVSPRQFAPASFRHPQPMKARTTTKLLIAVIGIAVFATVGVLAGFIER